MEGSKGIELLNAEEDRHGGVIVNVEDPIDPLHFASLLEASISNWRQQVHFQCNIISTSHHPTCYIYHFIQKPECVLQGKKGVWIKLPLQRSNLVDTAVKVGRYTHCNIYSLERD